MLLLILVPDARAQTDDLHLQHKELIAKIKRDMSEADRLLVEAGSDSATMAKERLVEVDEDIQNLLASVMSRQRSAIENIEELIRLRNYQPGGS